MNAIDTVIVAFRSEDVIETAVKAAEGLGGTVVVIDHGDGTSARRAATLGAIVQEDPTNPGFGAGQNHGVTRTSAPYVLLCNPDAEIVPRALALGARYLDDHPGVAAVQGVVVNSMTEQPERSAGVELGPLHLLGRAVGARRLLRAAPVRAVAQHIPRLRDHAQRVPSEPVDVESLAATAVLIRRAAFDSVAGFDESYFLYGEDLDLCHRLRAAGWKLVALPEVWASHASGASAESSWDREVAWWQGTMQFAARWWSTEAYLTASAAAFIVWARLAVRRPLRSRDTAGALLVRPCRQRSRQAPPLAAKLNPPSRTVDHY